MNDGGRVPSSFVTRIVGVSFAREYPWVAGRIEAVWAHQDWAGAEWAPVPALLRRDPGNEHDPNAIQVWLPEANQTSMLGHLERRWAARIAPLIDAGESWSAEVVAVANSQEQPASPGISVRVHRTHVSHDVLH